MGWGPKTWGAASGALGNLSDMLAKEVDRRYKRKKDDEDLKRLEAERAENQRRYDQEWNVKQAEAAEKARLAQEAGQAERDFEDRYNAGRQPATYTMNDINDIAGSIRGGFSTNAYKNLSSNLNTQSSMARRDALTDQGQQRIGISQQNADTSAGRLEESKSQNEWGRQFREDQQSALNRYRQGSLAIQRARLALHQAALDDRISADLNAQLDTAQAKIDKITAEIATMPEPDFFQDQKGYKALSTKHSELQTELKKLNDIERKIAGKAKKPPKADGYNDF